MKGFLLDTNIVSELARRRPDPNVTFWLENQNPSDLFLSSITLGELIRGASKVENTQRGTVLRRWISEKLTAQFRNRILSFDIPAANVWGTMMGKNDARGNPLPPADAQIAAIAKVHNLMIVTRNTKDFYKMVDSLTNPFIRT